MMDAVPASPDIWKPSPGINGWASPTVVFWNDPPRDDAPGLTVRRFLRLSETSENILGELAVGINRVEPSREIMLMAWGSGRPLTRCVLRQLAQWIFGEFAYRRLVLHIRASDERSQDYARRLGFQHEGRARAFYDDGETASIWAMLGSDAPRWSQRHCSYPAVNAPSTRTIQ